MDRIEPLRACPPPRNPKNSAARSRPSWTSIAKRIRFLRGHRVLLTNDLAELYQVQPREVVQAVKRNIERFPDDFMVQVTEAEFGILRSQTVISSWGGTRYRPYAFTEQGVAMLSSVLRSKRAIEVNIEIMRAFVRLRELLAGNQELAKKLAELEKKHDLKFLEYDGHLKVVFEAINQLLAPPSPPRRRLGFVPPRHKG